MGRGSNNSAVLNSVEACTTAFWTAQSCKGSLSERYAHMQACIHASSMHIRQRIRIKCARNSQCLDTMVVSAAGATCGRHTRVSRPSMGNKGRLFHSQARRTLLCELELHLHFFLCQLKHFVALRVATKALVRAVGTEPTRAAPQPPVSQTHTDIKASWEPCPSL